MIRVQIDINLGVRVAEGITAQFAEHKRKQMYTLIDNTHNYYSINFFNLRSMNDFLYDTVKEHISELRRFHK